MGNTTPTRKNKRYLTVDTAYTDMEETNEKAHLKCSIAAILLALSIDLKTQTFKIPNLKLYRGIFCHSIFKMNMCSHFSYTEWVNWINVNTMLQSSFLDAYEDDIKITGRIVHKFNDSSFSLLVYNTNQIIRIPEKLIFKHMKSPREVTSCPIFSENYKINTEVDFSFDIMGIWDLLFFNIYYTNICVYKDSISCSPVLPNINGIVDIEKRDYNVTKALDIICDKWLYHSDVSYLVYWSEKAFDDYLFEYKRMKKTKFNSVVNTVNKHSLAYNFVSRVFMFIGGSYEFLVPNNYIKEALFYDENPLEALKYLLNCQTYSKHRNLWFLCHCYQICTRETRRYSEIVVQYSYIRTLFFSFSKCRSKLDHSKHFYFLRGDIHGSDIPFELSI